MFDGGKYIGIYKIVGMTLTSKEKKRLAQVERGLC